MWGSNFVSNLLLVCLLVVSTGGITVAADENSQEPTRSTPIKSQKSGPYCGLNCLYTAMKLTNREVDFRKLVKPEYIGSHKGSSLAELKKAAEDNGLYAVSVGKLTSRVLQSCPHPVILHVKPGTTSKIYDHYELFLGTNSGQARLFDPPNPISLVPFRELIPRWDGNGLIVAAEPIDLAAIFAPARKRFIMYAAIGMALIITIRWARRWLPHTILNSRGKLLGVSITQGAGVAIAALMCGMFYHFANDEGLLANANATASIQQAHLGNFIPKVSEKKVRELLDSDTVFIDARRTRDFKAGHLKGAINLPVDANDVEHQKVTADIAKDASIVLYCQSAGCKFAEIVAIKLMADGFYNISIFRGGWAEWVTKNGKPKELTI